MVSSFKSFIMRGNVVDMAIGVIIGTAFGDIVNSLVEDIFLPPIGLILGRLDFSNIFLTLAGGPFATLAEAQEAGAPTINLGLFVNAVINFVIIAWIMFMVMRWANNLYHSAGEKEAPAEPATKDCPFCITTIAIGATRCPHCTSELAA